MRKILLFVIIGLATCHLTEAQIDSNTDSLVVKSLEDVELFEEISTKDPNRAAMLSAVFPGLGQVYNEQYWKLPIVYGVGFTLGYYIKYNHDYYQSLQNALRALEDNDPNTINPYTNLNASTLTTRTERFRRDRDFLIIVSTLAYLLNIVDAHISAHLEEFAINKELSLVLQPSTSTLPNGYNAMGLSLALKFK